MLEFNSDQPIKWADIMYFAAKMLGRVKNGQQNFYVADLVNAAAPTINVMMTTPVTGPKQPTRHGRRSYSS